MTAVAADALLLTAAAEGDADEVARLVQFDSANVDTRDANGATALHFASRRGDQRLLALLAALGADLDARESVDLGGNTVRVLTDRCLFTRIQSSLFRAYV